MNLQERIDLMARLGDYMLSADEEWQSIKQKAYIQNQWFTPEFIDLASQNLASEFLERKKLQEWALHYHLDDNISAKKVGIIMAGNIPLVGFHDLLCVFISGHIAVIKLSSKDTILMKFIIQLLISWNRSAADKIIIAEKLTGCDAYIATGSNNSARYFNAYFGKFPSIIRSSRTSVAVIEGNETEEELSLLADDMHTYFGLGCRNVTKLYVPAEYDFVPLLTASRKYSYFSDHAKYRNNFDYYLALQIMNNRFYMTNQSLLLLEHEELFTPVSQVNYSFYESYNSISEHLKINKNIQAIVGHNHLAFGKGQTPAIMDYADDIDTMQFLLSI